MCGICGKICFRDMQAVDLPVIQTMARSLAHRGPDDEGYYVSGHVGLGFRRLSIIDLVGGHQPMTDQEKRVWVVFNGEIYNFQDLRRELEGYGHVFRTCSDTEVIVYGYKQWKTNVLNHLNGMFGLAIWDTECKQLMLARYPMGIKTLYYHVNAGVLHFGSEIRPLLAAGCVKAQVDPEAMYLFLRYRYTPAPLTIFRGIRKLVPGGRLIVRDGKVREDRWWNFKPEPFDPMPSTKEAEEQLLELYRGAVKRQMISDVPLGLLLSGGIDSGLLLGLMGSHDGGTKTYTVGYGTSYAGDELDDAAETASLFGAENHSIRMDQASFEDTLSHIVSVLEEPVASSSVVPMYHVCERARQDVTVALVGQGPDELFGGYLRHLGVRYGEWWRRIPGPFRRVLSEMLSLAPRNETIGRALYSLDVPDRMKRYREVFALLSENRINALFQDGVLTDVCGERILECWRDLMPLMENLDELGGFQFLEVRSSLPDELLMYADKLSMAHSLEIRVPYLDLEIVRFVERLSMMFKIRWGKRKWLHRRVCSGFLPEQIIKRKKRGFAVDVVNGWYRNSLQGKVGNYLQDPESMIYGYLKHEEIGRLLKDHTIGKKDNHKILFSLVVMEEWLRCFQT